MPRHKAGLHKEITSIFDGVPVPKDDGTEQSSAAPMQDGMDTVAEELVAPSLETEQPEPIVSESEQPSSILQEAVKPAIEQKAVTTIETIPQVSPKTTFGLIKNKLFAPKPGVSASRQKAMVVLIPVLAIVFIFMFVRVFITSPGQGRSQASSVRPSGKGSADTKIEWQVPELYPVGLRDPMQFASPTATTTTATTTTIGDESKNIVVRGIVYSEDNPSVVIGSQILHEGTEVLGATIIKINKDSVVFEKNGERWTQAVQDKEQSGKK